MAIITQGITSPANQLSPQLCQYKQCVLIRPHIKKQIINIKIGPSQRNLLIRTFESTDICIIHTLRYSALSDLENQDGPKVSIIHKFNCLYLVNYFCIPLFFGLVKQLQ